MNKVWKLLGCGHVVCSLVLASGAAEAQVPCESAQLSSPDGQVGNSFGPVALSGDVVVVGDPGALQESVGVAYVFRFDGSDWVQETVLKAPEPNPEERFGRAVAVSGDVVVVAAHHANAPEFQRGGAYIFRYDPETSSWAFEAELLASEGDAGDLFGWSVSIDGDAVLIGARDDENDGVTQSGSAYVFRYNPDTSAWVEEAKLTDPAGEQGDLLGQSVSIRGDVALIGGHGNNHACNVSGSAFIFRCTEGRWTLETELTDPDPAACGWFGSSVSLIEDLLLVGSPQDDGQTGSVDVFRYDSEAAAWGHDATLAASEPVGPWPFFGASVSTSAQGEIMLVGAPGDFVLGFESGAAHVFSYDGIDWTELAKLTASDGGANDHFGGSVAVCRNIALIAAPRQSEEQGSVYVFDLNPIPGDFDCDGTIGILDLLTLLANWGPCGDCESCPADLLADCTVGILDLLILLGNWG